MESELVRKLPVADTASPTADNFGDGRVRPPPPPSHPSGRACALPRTAASSPPEHSLLTTSRSLIGERSHECDLQ